MFGRLVVVDTIFRDWLRNTRSALGLTQKDVAEMAGVTQTTVSQWEAADPAKRNLPNPKNLRRLAKGLKIKYSQVEYLIDMEGQAVTENEGLGPISVEQGEMLRIMGKLSNPNLRSLLAMAHALEKSEQEAANSE